MIGDLPATLLKKIFASADSCVAGAASPPGRAIRVNGGYRLTGRWAWASGIHQAKWVAANCLIFDGDRAKTTADGAPVALAFVVPKEACRILDTWHVGGMRGTGSTEFEIADYFVPTECALHFFSEAATNPYPIFRLPPTFFGYNHVSVLTGIARSAVTGLKTLASAKTSALSGTSLRDEQQAQYAVAKAEALIDAGGLNVKESFRPVWDKVRAGEPILPMMRARVRRAVALAAENAIEAVQLCYRAAGGSAIYDSAPFERALRDVNAAACHVTMRSTMMEQAGRVAFDLPPQTPFF
jgi:alkylation response protein AidB-like acyl-CoA dehydrogenase